jgi:hypothetical protein
MSLKHGLAFRKSARAAAALLSVLTFSAVSASANPVTYTGEDIMATTTSAHPNSSAAASSFYSAASGIGIASTIDFESAPLGSFSSLTAAPGVTITGTDINGNNQTIRNTSNSPAFPTLDGYNTTPGGAGFLEMQAGTVTFNFATPTQFFGAYFSGVQNFYPDEDITFSDGTSELISIPEAGTSGSIGALDFVGFTDAGKFITSVTINAGNANTGADYIGIDDVTYQSAPNTTVTPEPDSIVLVLTGCLGLATGIRRRWFV